MTDELERLRAVVAKVATLANDLSRVSAVLIDKPDSDGEYDTGKALEGVVDDLRAVLASVPEPSEPTADLRVEPSESTDGEPTVEQVQAAEDALRDAGWWHEPEDEPTGLRAADGGAGGQQKVGERP